MKFLGIDYGTKRVGIAVSDEEGRVAFPKTVLLNSKSLKREVLDLLRIGNVDAVVLGESRDFGGRENILFLKAKEFGELLKKEGVRVFFEQEFLSSVEAGRFQGKRDTLDASAAAVILQRFLDKQHSF